jgi:hypothetical protein
VLVGELPKQLQEAAEMYAGCVAGASQKTDYLGYIEQAGFKNIIIQKDNPIILPDDILENYLSKEEITAYRAYPPIIHSITVYAEKQGCACSLGCC